MFETRGILFAAAGRARFQQETVTRWLRVILGSGVSQLAEAQLACKLVSRLLHG